MYFSFEINKLGPIRDSKIEFNRFLLLTGNSNTGKSYVSLLVYYFLKSISSTNRLVEFVKNEFNVQELEKELSETKRLIVHIKVEKFNTWINQGAEKYLCYLLKREKMDCDVNIISGIESFDINVDLIYSNMNQDAVKINNFKVLGKTYTAEADYPLDMAIARLIFLAISSNFIKLSHNLQTLLLPPARGALMGFTYSDKSALATSAGMYKEFLTDFDKLSNRESEEDIFLTRILSNCIDGNIVLHDDDIYYEQQNKFSIPLSSVASSIKELSPLVLSLCRSNPVNLSITIEEPEAHLHPDWQIEIAKLIAYLVNKGTFIQVTTHSDLFLTQINHLLRIGKLRTIDSQLAQNVIEKYSISEDLILSESNINAYYFVKDSTGCTTIYNQNLTDGIPFDSFKKTYERLYEESNYIDDLFLNTQQ